MRGATNGQTVLLEAVCSAQNGERARRCAVSKILSKVETVDRNDRRYVPFDAPAEDGVIIDDDVIGGIGIPWRHTRPPSNNP